MFIRKTATRNKSTDEPYFTFRLVSSERTGKQVRQITLLNPGRYFDLPQGDWPRLCRRIDALLAGQSGMLAEPLAIETLAQRYTARLIAPSLACSLAQPDRPPAAPPPASSPAQPAAAAPPPAIAATPDPVYAEVDIASLQLTRPRFVGVEAAGRAAMGWLGIEPLLTGLGFNRVQRDAVAGLLVGRMHAPAEAGGSPWQRTRYLALAARTQRAGRAAGRRLRSHAADPALPHLRSARAPPRQDRGRAVQPHPGSVRPAGHGDALRSHQHLFRGRRRRQPQGRARPVEREARRLSAGHTRSRARCQRLRPPIADVRR